ncbi:peptidylprolyl isomerase [Chloroflexota bacterium]
MQISKNKVVTFDFTVTSESGEILDTSKDSAPFCYIHGIGRLIPGLESGMDGKSTGDKFLVTVLPAQAYGERDEELIQAVPKTVFQGIEDLEVGQHLQIEDQSGMRITVVRSIEEDSVTLDGNHPMAGMSLNFDINVVEVRDATEEEMASGFPAGQKDCGCGCNDASCQDDSCQDDSCNGH